MADSNYSRAFCDHLHSKNTDNSNSPGTYKSGQDTCEVSILQTINSAELSIYSSMTRIETPGKDKNEE